MQADRTRMTLLFALLLLAHAAHVGEEAWGRLWLIDAFYGMERFLAGNVLLFAGAILLFDRTLQGDAWARRVSIAYAAFMAFQGIGHNVGTLVTGRYFGGAAGGFTGIALFAFGVPLVRELRAEMRASRAERKPLESPEPSIASMASAAASRAGTP